MTYDVTPRPHIVRVPRHTILLRLFQLFIATATLILTAYGVSVLFAPGIILTLVAGRPLPPAFHAEDFSTHTQSGNGTAPVAVVPANTTALHNSAGVLNSTASSVARPGEGLTALPTLAPKVWTKRDNQVPVGPKYAESGRELVGDMIPFNDMNLAKLCPSPAYLGAPASAYPVFPSKDPGSTPPSIPPPESDLHDGMRDGEYITITGAAKYVAKRAFENMREKVQSWKVRGREYKVAGKEIWSYSHTNPWGAPMKRSALIPPPDSMMWGHLQTAILSILHLVLTLLSTYCPTFAHIYDYPLLWILETFLVILWLISFCVLSAQIMLSQAIGYGTACSEDGYCYTYSSWDKRKHFLRLMSCTAVLSGLMFLLYLVSFSIFTASVLKHRREGGAKKPLSPEAKDSHPGPFSFDDTHELEEARNNTTDEEAGNPGKKGRKVKYLEKQKAKVMEKTRKEDEKAIQHMKRGANWKRKNGVIVPVSPGEKVKKVKKEKSHKLSLHGLQTEQMRLSLGGQNGQGRGRSEVEAGVAAPYSRGA